MTYRVTDGPRHIQDGNNETCLTLADEYGGKFHITVDDHCYVLVCEREGKFMQTSHWFREASEALRTLPANPDEAPRPSPVRLVK